MKHRLIVAFTVLLLGSVLIYLQSLPAPGPRTGTTISQTNAARTAKPAPPIARADSRRSSTNSSAAAATSAASHEEQPPAFVAFAKWADRFRAGDLSADTAQGEALAWKRREAMEELIETDPAKAIALTVPFEWRETLPERITRHFEEQVDGRGALNVAVATDFNNAKTTVMRTAQIGGTTYRAFVYGRRTAQVSKTDIPLHGIAITPRLVPNSNPSANATPSPAIMARLALSPDPIRPLTADEAVAREKKYGQAADTICGVSGKPADYRQQEVAADIGGEVRHFCGVDHLKLVNDRWRLAESGGNGAFADAAPSLTDDRWTHGPKTVLYMRLNFPDDLTDPISEASSYSVMDGVNRFYTDTSFNLTSLDPTVTPLLTLPQTKGWYSTAGPFALLDDARAVARSAGFDTVNYDWDIASFTDVPGFDFGGLAYVHGKGVWLQSPGVKVTSHELGHNYGLYHANFWDTLQPYNYSSAISAGTNIEYGNLFDTMGFGVGQFNAVHKNTLNWIPNSSVHDVISNGVYRIYAYDRTNRVNGRLYAAKVRKDYQRTYWIEFRVEETFNPPTQNGVLLNWAAWDESNGGTSLLDTTPGTLDVNDSALTIGRTFSDASAGVHITPLARSATGIEPYMDVQVNIGAFPANVPPVMKVEIDPTNALPGQLVHFHATASDPNGDTLAYAWTFDDGTFSTNNQPWVAKSWSQSGAHIVRCAVSDMKGGSASANAVVIVGQPSGFRISGVVLDENADPIEGVRVDTGITNVPYMSSYSDSDGYFVLITTNADLHLEANRYGYSFTNLWQDPLQVSGSVSNLVFIGTRLREVSLVASTNRVAEGNGAANQLTLTRTGSTSEDLTVTLFVSGTANVPADLTFSPFLSDGENTIVIPAGANHVTFTFAPVNDATVEETETANITVLEDTNYFIAPLAEVHISILDNEDPAQPAVSVEAQNSLIPETGMDSGIFVFSRTGLTNSALTVFYSTGGTATPGTDYPTLLGVVIIPAGRRSATVEFRPFDDKDVEPDETVIVTITTNGAYSGGGSSATTTIVNDDLLTVTISPTVANAAEPSTSGRFTVKRDGDLTGNLVVYYTLSGTASNGVDYASPSGAITIPANQTSADIIITPIDDALVEGDESVSVTLVSNPGYNIGTAGSATLFIRDNEKPTINVSTPDNSASEPGSDFGQFRISRGSVVNGDLTVNFIINGNAINGTDYVPLENSAVIPQGSSSVTLDVIPFDDLHLEPEETVILTLVPSTNYNLGTVTDGTVFIEDDDSSSVPAAGFSFATSSALESESPGISVSLSHTSSVPITVNYRILGGTASNLLDYALPNGPLTFDPGELAKSIPLFIYQDSLVEPNETIRIALYDPTNATLDGIKIHLYTIIDIDAAAVSVAATANASETGLPGNFRITRIGSTNSSLTVNYQITGTASAPSDFAALGTSATIPAGAAFVDIPVTPVNDGVVELDETIVMTLISAPSGRIVAPASATITLSDNDPNSLPVVSISSTNHPNAFEGGGNGEFVFTRTGSTTGAISLNVTILGSASNGSDYSMLSNVVTIPIGQSSVTIPVVPVDDSQVEGDETVTVALEVRDTYRVSFAAFATVTIQDNDQTVRLDASDFEAVEAGPVPDFGAFTFTRFGTTNLPVQVFFTISGTASNGVDYVALPNSFVIPAGSLTATLPVVPLDDSLVEGPEKVTLTLQSNAAYVLASPATATVTIQDDEPMISIIASVPSVIEGNPQPGMFTILRGGNPDNEFTARLSVGGTAAYGVDYPAFATNVFFAYGVVAVDLLVFPTNELVIENNETVVATLVPNPAYSIVPPNSATITIKDAATNSAPVVTITSPKAKTVFLLGTNVNMILESTVIDDGGTNTPVTVTWTNVSGPDALSFGAADQANTTVSLTNSGVYVLRITADDGVLTNYAEVTVVVDTLQLLSTNLLHWALDQTSGTNVPDSSGNGHAGTITGPANWVTNGAMGGALRLTGTNNFIRETPASAFLNGLKQFSLAVWVKTTATNSDGGVFTADDSGPGSSLTLATRGAAAYGSATNAVQADLVTTRGQIRHVSASNAISNDWQQITLTWSNGLALAMFLDGRLDQPNSHMVPLRGTLTNCPQFVIGKGPLDIASSWKGFIDDVRVFPRALQPAEVAGLVATNYAPIVDVTTNLTVQVITPVELSALVTDDGRPNPPGAVTIAWSQISGPLTVSIPDPTSLTNTVQFIQSGDYVFRVIADDGQVKMFDDLPVTVVEPTTVSVVASDGDAAELGPDNTGEFTFSRVGDVNFNLTIHVTMSGSASNGADFVFIPQTTSVTLPSGIDSLVIPVTPFLDHRTEGDETVTYTIVSNLAYTISSGEATVTIHDSPYGVWNIAHFTLEELTDPNLSGEGTDYDHDRLLNFAEYAINRDPKSVETNAPVTTAIEFNPADSKNHITITYQRRIDPTDVAYEVRVSNDLHTWNSGAAYVEELQATDDGNNLTQTVKARVIAPWPATGNAQFISIRVWLKTTGP